MKRIGVVAILFLAFCGLADSAYLTQHELSGTPLICNIQNISGCNIVANSPYAHLFGVPLAEYGVFFYGILFVLAALELVLFDRVLRRVLQGVALFGALASLCFELIQAFLIGAFCIYCLVSALITLLVLILASFIEPIRLSKNQKPPVTPVPPHPLLPPTT
ncbi:MAG TPA: vitamin K epoxide reductase family protein [Candidatus Paceibacterota bacterium]|nr:vitamin K epoxide reductase family protein [Candidatus Paceibacterota bacterium]